MATKTITVTTCDLCEERIDEPYSGGAAGTYKLKVDVDYTASGERIDWNELCQTCHGFVVDTVKDLRNHQDKVRKEKKK